jgi:hypothetical protein
MSATTGFPNPFWGRYGARTEQCRAVALGNRRRSRPDSDGLAKGRGRLEARKDSAASGARCFDVGGLIRKPTLRARRQGTEQTDLAGSDKLAATNREVATTGPDEWIGDEPVARAQPTFWPGQAAVVLPVVRYRSYWIDVAGDRVYLGLAPIYVAATPV